MTELDVQRRAFVSMLIYIINNINVTQVFSTISQLGMHVHTSFFDNTGGRHIIYGVSDEDYRTFGNALVLALQKTLGKDRATEEVCAVWQKSIDQMSEMMQRSGEVIAKGNFCHVTVALTLSTEGINGILRRQRSNGAWISQNAHLTLTTLTLFKDKNVLDIFFHS